MERGLHLIIVIYIFVVWMANNVLSDCCMQNPKVPTFQTCRYRCHCKEDVQCDKTSGVCPNRCEEGWMGPRCQYRNLAASFYSDKEYARFTNVSHPSSESFDDDYRIRGLDYFEHLSHHSLTIHFFKPYEVLGLIINVPPGDVGKHFFRIETSENILDEQFPTTCYENSTINTTMEIMCRQSRTAVQLKITLETPKVHLDIWEVEIYGGRSLAFNKPSEQESTRIDPRRKKDNRSACFAVDGYEYIPVFVLPVCSSTFDISKQWWRVDLLNQYRLNEIVIQDKSDHYSHDARDLQGLYFLYGSDLSSLTVFHNDKSGGIYKQPHRSFQISIDVTGRYLQIESRRNTTLVLCEVFVFGECPINKCGFDCTLDCFCATNVTGIYSENGICPYGCQDGWTGEGQRCDQQIVLGTRQSRSSTSCVSSTVGVGVAMAIVIAALIGVIIILIYRHQKYKRVQEQRVTYTSVNHAVTPTAEGTYDQLSQEPEAAQPIPVYMELH